MHPRSGPWHLIDFIVTRCRDKMDIHSTRAMSGANGWTDHQMLRSNVAFRIRQKHNRQGTSKPYMLNTVPSAIRGVLSSRWTVLSPNDWWEKKAVEVPRAADRNNTKSFYNGLKEVWRPKQKGPVHLESTDESCGKME
ncbi:hypothetical protein NP493_798g02007 [Ridgeia piscesae]|uniref:Uncharacterized protein n=1 Tax=Ridgeia piscesae TaxID=27915 RepID=A0AAD9KNJ3_RIDPI|nr:hypothetical protein NP493_798g02007 [Ridgeia piscesae]